MSQSSRMSTGDIEHYQEDLEPGQLRLDDMLKNPQSKNQTVLYKMLSPVVGRGRNNRKQTLETLPSLSNDEDIGESSGQEDVMPMDSDQASTSGAPFVVPKAPAKSREKKQPPAAAAAAAAKKRANTNVKRVTKTKSKAPTITLQDGEDESDEDSNQPSGNEDGDDFETQRGVPPPKKTKRTYNSRVPKETKRSVNPKGPRAVGKAFDDNVDEEDIEIIDVSGPPVEEKKAFQLRISPSGEKDALFLSHEKYEKNGMFYLGLRRINTSGYKTWMRIKPDEIAGLEKGIAIVRKKLNI